MISLDLFIAYRMDKDKLSPKVNAAGSRSPKHERSKSPKPDVSDGNKGELRTATSSCNTQERSAEKTVITRDKDHRASPKPGIVKKLCIFLSIQLSFALVMLIFLTNLKLFQASLKKNLPAPPKSIKFQALLL